MRKMNQKQEHYELEGVIMTCRSFDEYSRMFALNPVDMNGLKVLDVAGGASSFAAAASHAGAFVQAVDPIYALSFNKLKEKGLKEIEAYSSKVADLQHVFTWDYYGSPQYHRAMREASLQMFIQDFEQHKGSRYISGQLPDLPLAKGTFDYVLCSHFLFLYAEQFGYEFHLQAIQEMLRVCKPGGEVRIYPLVNLKWKPYSHMEMLCRDLMDMGVETSRIKADLPFIPGSDELFVARYRA
jgi:ubiquinone/menaquinone biosynthesis C-methylase UbiE